MKRYETTAIVDPDVSPEDRSALLDRCQDIINQQNGLLLELDEWGKQKACLRNQKKLRGFYARFDYCGDGNLVQELERSFRIDDRVLKFLTVLLQKDVDPEKIKESMTKSEQPEEKAPDFAEISSVSEIPETEPVQDTEPETRKEE